MTMLQSHNSTGTYSQRAALRRLCQPAQVARLLRAAARQCGIEQASIDEVCIERCWPGRDGAYLFEWSFETDGGRARLYGRCSFQEADDRRESANTPDLVERPTLRRGVRVWQPRWGATVFSCDRDPGLPHLAACLDRQPAAAVAALFPRGTTLDDAHLLAYKPGRRATIHFAMRSRSRSRGAAAPSAAGKTFRDDRGRRLLAIHQQVRSQLRKAGAAITVPAPLGYIEAMRLAVVEWIDVDRGADRKLGARDFVAALIDLHRIEVDDLATHTVDSECAVVRHWHEHLQVLRPADADRTWPLVEELCRRGPELADESPCVIHRDFYERQLLAGAKGPALIDLDTLAWGDRCVDLGNLAAHLALTRVAGGERVRAASLCREVAELYQAHGRKIDRRRMEYYAAASLFRVAAVHAVRTTTRRCARPLLRLAADLMEIGTPLPLGATL